MSVEVTLTGTIPVTVEVELDDEGHIEVTRVIAHDDQLSELTGESVSGGHGLDEGVWIEHAIENIEAAGVWPAWEWGG